MKEHSMGADKLLVEMDISPIASPVEIGRIDRSLIPQMVLAAGQDADQANMFMRISLLLCSSGKMELGLEMHQRALQFRRVFRYRCARTPAIRLLAIMGAGGGQDNAPVEYLLENSDVQLDLVFLDENGELPDMIPDHDVAIIALGEAYKNRGLIEGLGSTFAVWPRPVINQPMAVLNCSRDKLYSLLKDTEGLVVAATVRMSRRALVMSSFPKIIRPVDAHGGAGLEKIESESMLSPYLAARVEDEFYVSDYIDYSSPDGLFRKVRIALIDGRPYVCHVAISDHWIVHYIPAGMELSAAKRREEQEMMETFDERFVKLHGAALQAIYEKLQLDFVVLDCSSLADGRLLLFEADSRGWIHNVDPVDVFPYKPAIMQKAFDAFRAMLARRIEALRRIG